MIDRPIPLREAGSAVFLLLLLTAVLLLEEADPAAGPLGAMTAVACVHAALVAPACAGAGSLARAFLPVPLALPAIAAAAYGHGMAGFAGALALLLLSCAAGASARRLPCALYQPLALIQFLAPFALGYLAAEFGGASSAAWRGLSPLGACLRLDEGDAPSATCLLLLGAWPVLAIAWRRR